MKIIFTLFLFLSLIMTSMAQTRVVSGRLLDSRGIPMPGVNILVKGTTIGTSSDGEGNYSIHAPVGSTLVFSCIGMQTREVVVTADNFKTVKADGSRRVIRSRLKPIPGSLYADSVVMPTPGVAILDDRTPTYYGDTPDPARIKSIKRLGSRYMIRTIPSGVEQRSGFGLQLATTIGIEQVTQLPALQDQFAQGRPDGGVLTWRGADSREIYSWGPLVRTLEYDGGVYPYDQHGRLVSAGTGNGIPAQTYDATTLFRTGWMSATELTLMLPARGNGKFSFDIEDRSGSGVISNSAYHKLNMAAGVKNFRWSRHLTADAKVSYNRSRGNLINHGANLATIVGGIYRTPATFDNTNGYSTRSIQPAAYQLPEGALRSHAPQQSDNPYGLVHQLPDRDELDRLLSMVSLHYKSDKKFDLDASGDLDYQQGRNIFGLPPGYSGYRWGRITDRRDKQTVVSAAVSPSFRDYSDLGEFKLGLTYQVNYTDRTLDRVDGIQFNDDYGMDSHASFRFITGNRLSRVSQEATLNLSQFFNEWLLVSLSNSSYFSNTLPSHRYTNIFPAAGFKAILTEPLEDLGPIDYLDVHGSISRTIREAPLLYSNWSYRSTQMDAGSYASFSEASELYFNTNLAPEIERKFQVGVRTYAFGHNVHLDISYFNNLVDNFVAPVWNGYRYDLGNVATIRNYGTDITADYTKSFYSGGSWGIGLRWSKYNNVVDELYGQTSWVPLAGFNSIQSVLAPGKPVGAIYGTGYLRDAGGRMIIGADGFPVKDAQLRMLGSPIPDWTLGLTSHLLVGKFRFSMVIDSRRGGQMWNGTQAALDYLGRSAATGAQRNSSGYVFDGVTEQGTPNTKTVSFADPTVPVSQNRWTRYGWDGVGETYIEDMSWIRLNEVALSYTLHRDRNRTLKEIKFLLSGRNLLLITGYSGVDPSTSLFGYATGAGLDMFNTPSIRSYSAQITLKI